MSLIQFITSELFWKCVISILLVLNIICVGSHSAIACSAAANICEGFSFLLHRFYLSYLFALVFTTHIAFLLGILAVHQFAANNMKLNWSVRNIWSRFLSQDRRNSQTKYCIISWNIRKSVRGDVSLIGLPWHSFKKQLTIVKKFHEPLCAVLIILSETLLVLHNISSITSPGRYQVRAAVTKSCQRKSLLWTLTRT